MSLSNRSFIHYDKDVFVYMFFGSCTTWMLSKKAMTKLFCSNTSFLLLEIFLFLFRFSINNFMKTVKLLSFFPIRFIVIFFCKVYLVMKLFLNIETKKEKSLTWHFYCWAGTHRYKSRCIYLIISELCKMIFIQLPLWI